ncbi:MAG TPA: response regulator [Puia sp.]|nr:response regulator [Puia sp.]
MNPISFTRSVVLGHAVTTLTTALRGRRKVRKPADISTHPDLEFRPTPDQSPSGLPASNGCVESPATPSVVFDTAGAYTGLLQNIPILVVDDNPIHQQIAARILEFAGATVTVAGNGEQAVLLLEREQYDLIIMDLVMPVMDGYAATRYIRNHLRLDTPVLALTADPTPGRRTRCLQAGMNDYMLKPFALPDLFERISRLLH